MYNRAQCLKDIDREQYANVAISYEMAVRIVNVLEDLHAQCDLPADRFIDYPAKDYIEIDTRIRDNMANLAISLECRHHSAKG